jgi:hypothetical protein
MTIMAEGSGQEGLFESCASIHKEDIWSTNSYGANLELSRKI